MSDTARWVLFILVGDVCFVCCQVGCVHRLRELDVIQCSSRISHADNISFSLRGWEIRTFTCAGSKNIHAHWCIYQKMRARVEKIISLPCWVSRVEKRAEKGARPPAYIRRAPSKCLQCGPRPIFLACTMGLFGLELGDFLQDKCQELHALHHIHFSGLNYAFCSKWASSFDELNSEIKLNYKKINYVFFIFFLDNNIDTCFFFIIF